MYCEHFHSLARQIHRYFAANLKTMVVQRKSRVSIAFNQREASASCWSDGSSCYLVLQIQA
jgi:hypothetical protein